MEDGAEVERTCVVCFARPAGTRLEPCGHSVFCRECTRRFRTCPICRAPIHLDASGAPWQAHDEAAPPARPPVLNKMEMRFAIAVCTSMYLFIFVVGLIEFMRNIPASCYPGDPALSRMEAAMRGQEVVMTNVRACMDRRCDSRIGCYECKEGFINHGKQCFRYIENLPSFSVGAALGGTVYFVLIVVTQVGGILCELLLVCRLMGRGLMPRKELVVIGMALVLEITRMFLVDFFMLQDYFGNASYNIFRAPTPCAAGSIGAWRGADGATYCSSLDLPSEGTGYYIATSREAFSGDADFCSTFLRSSALLNFKRDSGRMPDQGAARFENIGWVIGGEFALYYLFATFINELADNIFIVPTTTTFGWKCKIFSVVLEVFQLGALCPAAIFTHGDCLHYNNPLGASLHMISVIVTGFGYAIWGSMFFAPVCVCATLLVWLPVKLLLSLCDRRCHVFRGTFDENVDRLYERMKSSSDGTATAILSLAFWPVLLGGTMLGILVVIGQASKSGPMSVLTALVLLGDVLLKVGATVITEVADYLLHRRVVRAVRQRGSDALATPIGRPRTEPAARTGEQERTAGSCTNVGGQQQQQQ